MMPPLEDFPLARRASYALAAAAAIVVVVAGLGPGLVAGMTAYMVLSVAERRLRAFGAGATAARLGAVLLSLVLTAALIGVTISFARVLIERWPRLLERVLPSLQGLASRWGVGLPLENVDELKSSLIKAADANVHLLTAEGGLLTRGFFKILIAAAAALLAFSTHPGAHAQPVSDMDAALRRELGARARLFVECFERVMGAQFVIAGINAAATGVFLFALGLPFRTLLLLATFFLGVIPIAGNIVSNLLILAVALTVSAPVALAAAAFLFVSHKAQYFLSGRLVGDRIGLPTWGILVSLVVGEALMGLPGVILAPALVHYAREELRARPAA